jgi:hypothetical protein
MTCVWASPERENCSDLRGRDQKEKQKDKKGQDRKRTKSKTMAAEKLIPVTLAKEDAVKCTGCKCYRPFEEFVGKRVGAFKTCTGCRAKNKARREKDKCEHKKAKSRCAECGGSELCEQHGKVKSRCTECGDGSSLCEHIRYKYTCGECNPVERLRVTVRRRIARTLPGEKGLTTQRVNELLGITIEEYRFYLEGTFEEGMSWAIYGKEKGDWQIDHALALNPNVNSEDEVLERVHYTNTRAMWATENWSKGPSDDSEWSSPER